MVPSNAPAYLYQDMSAADLLDLSRSIGIKSAPAKRRDRNDREVQAYTVSGWTSSEAARKAAVRLSDDEHQFLIRFRPTLIQDLQEVVSTESGHAIAVSQRPFVIDPYYAEVEVGLPGSGEPTWMVLALYRLAPDELSPPKAGAQKNLPWTPKMSRAAWFAMKRRLGQLQPRRAA
ncbi:hypothetical protein [Microvirga massiliensis]|uniref:hypothetical protein n=1 Tax=Microvirga massiliensis TaxID=1033741 RepID=UPI00062B9CC2|nr:hypothetical protein [Microvirga massiliensis]